ncbi:MAG: cupin domain-containing protein [Clostridiales bacterium]|jgi:quercetin dioxygenase-like cupin family protein|nr:cupin domain-containing protein [Clostridiales bacterium]
MFIINENEKEYRFGDSGPKYLLNGPRLRTGVVRLKKDEDFKGHYHKIMEENFFILEGEIEFVVDGVSCICKKGDLIHIEPHEKHYLKNVYDGASLAVFILGPAAENDKYED